MSSTQQYMGTSIPLIPRAQRLKELQAKPSSSANKAHVRA